MSGKTERFYNIVSLATIALVVLPIGIASIVLGFGFGDNPCILCWQERAVMMFISLTTLFILRYGLRPKYLALLIFYCAIGIFMSLRHTGGHFLRDIGQGFALEILGFHTYSWGIFIYWMIFICLAIILGFFGGNLVDNEDGEVRYLTKLQGSAFVIFFIVLGINSIQAITQVGPPPFIGQSDPIRFSWTPKDWKWSTQSWANLMRPMSLRGKYHVEKPVVKTQAKRDIAMFESGDELIKVKEVKLPETIIGNITDIDYHPKSKLFALVTDQFYIYILDDKLSDIKAYVHLDNLFSIEIKTLTAVSFIDRNRLMVTGINKSYVILKLDKEAKLKNQYATFKDGTDGILETRRGRFSTVRSKYAYIQSLTFDRETNEFVTLSVPNKKFNKIIATRFSSIDYMLSSEKEVFTNESEFQPHVTSLKIYDSIAYGLAPDNREIIISDNNFSSFTGSILLPVNGDYRGVVIFEKDQFIIIDGNIASYFIN
ncbi:disulfide bond formation protein B [Halobacteriovorax sp.]|uniref:disulfide bond formation protein B n=1 Tax=Halobacteriovorax sp. TaxID=2020862 RepID=UPI003AF2DA5B